MSGRFEGLRDEQWKILSLFFPPPPKKPGKGQPPADRRKVLNSILYILITGCRWCDLPRGHNGVHGLLLIAGLRNGKKIEHWKESNRACFL